MKIMRGGKQVGVKTELADVIIYFETLAEYQRRTKEETPALDIKELMLNKEG